MVRFDIRLSDKADWVKIFDPRDSTIFVAHDSPPEVGVRARIDLTVGIEGEGPKVIFRGQVISRRMQGDSSLPRGFAVAVGPEEREKINYLNGFVRGGLLNLRERRRLPLRLPVRFQGSGEPTNAFTRDINEEGVFIVSEEPLPEETELKIMLQIPGVADSLHLRGIVSHTVLVEDEDVPGMGVRFVFAEGQAESFANRVDELERRFASGDVPDALLL